MAYTRFAAAVVMMIAMAGWTGCSSSQTDAEDGPRGKWASQKATSYEMIVNLSCFCMMRGDYQVVVQDNAVTSAIKVETNEPADEYAMKEIRTIDGYFEWIAELRDGKADSVGVEYNQQQGYPAKIFVDYMRQAADDEMWIEISNVSIHNQ